MLTTGIRKWSLGSRQNVLTCFPLPKQTYAYLGYLLDWLVVVRTSNAICINSESG